MLISILRKYKSIFSISFLGRRSSNRTNCFANISELRSYAWLAAQVDAIMENVVGQCTEGVVLPACTVNCTNDIFLNAKYCRHIQHDKKW